MNNKRLGLTIDNYKREKKLKRIVKITLLFIFLLLIIVYFVVGIIYNSGNFSITLDKNLYYEKGLIVYDDVDYKVFRSELYAKPPETFDNISYKWLPSDVGESTGGSHNGDNYLAYTFFIENTGKEVADYYSELVIDDVIKKVDEAVRIRVYKNGEATTYAKISAKNTAEEGTTPFIDEKLVATDHISNFKPGDIDTYTVVLWIEGSDPECNDNILGGEIKISMNFNSEHVEDKERGKV